MSDKPKKKGCGWMIQTPLAQTTFIISVCSQVLFFLWKWRSNTRRSSDWFPV